MAWTGRGRAWSGGEGDDDGARSVPACKRVRGMAGGENGLGRGSSPWPICGERRRGRSRARGVWRPLRRIWKGCGRGAGSPFAQQVLVAHAQACGVMAAPVPRAHGRPAWLPPAASCSSCPDIKPTPARAKDAPLPIDACLFVQAIPVQSHTRPRTRPASQLRHAAARTNQLS